MDLKFGCTGRGLVWYGYEGKGNVLMDSSSESLDSLFVGSKDTWGSLKAAEQPANLLTHLVLAMITVTILANAAPSIF